MISVNRWYWNSLCDHLFRRIPTVHLFGITACELPGLVYLDRLPILPDEVSHNSFGLAAVHHKYRTFLLLAIIAGRNIQHGHSLILPRFQLRCINMDIQCLAAGKVTNQFESVVGGCFNKPSE